MEAENKTLQEDGTAKAEKTHERSASYPALNLNEAIDFTNEIHKLFTNTPVKREEYARVLDVHANTLSRDFGACTQFGLLEKVPEGYKVSSLFDRIINPENSKEKKIAKLEALGTPKLYKELIEKFDGRYIEPEFPNTLIKHHHITAKAAPEAADTFIESAKQAEAMGENRVLKYRDTLSTTQKITGYAEVYDEEKPVDEVKTNNQIQLLTKTGQALSIPQNPSIKTIPIPLTKNKEAYFAYPEDMSANDVKLVESQLKVILMRIEFDNQEQNNNPVN